MVYPLKWVLPSISVLPPCLFDVLNAPGSFLGGVTEKIPVNREGLVVLDLATKTVQSGRQIPRFPDSDKFAESLKSQWDVLNVNRDEAAREICAGTTRQIVQLLDPLPRSIITHFSPPATGSTFVIELFLSHFRRRDRQFMQLMCQSQMMQYYIEQECRRQSQRFG
jgi:hypothetical protein